MPCALAAVDFSDVTDAVIEAAVKYARADTMPVVLVHVAPPDIAFSMGDDAPEVPHKTVEELINERRRMLDQLAERVQSQGLASEHVLLQGGAVNGIQETAEKHDAELIVVGSHGHGRLYDLILGSVAHGIIRHAQQPVMVIPAKPA